MHISISRSSFLLHCTRTLTDARSAAVLGVAAGSHAFDSRAGVRGCYKWVGVAYFSIGGRGAAFSTRRIRLSYPWPSSLSMARSASSVCMKLTKPKPRLRPVSRS